MYIPGNFLRRNRFFSPVHSRRPLNLALAVMMLVGLSLSLFSLEIPPAKADNNRCFVETGFCINGSFRLYWERKGGLEQFGFPISKEFMQYSPTEKGRWFITQYFQRAIFEYHGEYAGTENDVLLRLVGNLTTLDKGRFFSPGFPDPGKQFFEATKHTLGGKFLSYWQSRGGLPVYGFPLSEEFTELNPADGKTYTVQYFERARLEYHPELAGTRFEILMGLLGWQELQLCDVPESEGDIGQPYRNPPIVAGENPDQHPVNQPPIPVSNPTPVNLPGRTITPLRVPFGYGTNAWIYDLGNTAGKVLQIAGQAGFTWVRQQLRWDYIEKTPGQYRWNELDALVATTKTFGIKLVLSVVKAPKFYGVNGTNGLPADANIFYNFMSNVSQRYKGQVAAYEIWNEPNIGLEVGEVNIPRYVATLKAAYQAIKKNDPNAIVVTGGTTPTGVNNGTVVMDDLDFVTACYKYNDGEWRNYFDALGVHPGSAANSPDEFYPVDRPADKNRPWSTHPSFFFRRFENHRDVMVKYGDGDKQIWLTEFGWTTRNAVAGYEYGALNSEDQQANFIVRAYQRGKTKYDYIGVMLLWNLNFSTVVSANDEKAPWSILRSDYSPRPAYTAFKNMPK